MYGCDEGGGRLGRMFVMQVLQSSRACLRLPAALRQNAFEFIDSDCVLSLILAGSKAAHLLVN